MDAAGKSVVSHIIDAEHAERRESKVSGTEVRRLRRSSSLPAELGRRPFTLRKSLRASKILSRYRITNFNHMDSLTEVLSGLYAMILVVVGASHPVSHILAPLVIKEEIEAFYIYLYLVGISFMAFVYLIIIRAQQTKKLFARMTSHYGKHSAAAAAAATAIMVVPSIVTTAPPATAAASSAAEAAAASGASATAAAAAENDESEIISEDLLQEEHLLQKSENLSSRRQTNPIVQRSLSRFTFSTTNELSGSFYLRLGALIFGICTIVDNGFELIVMIETLTARSSCNEVKSSFVIRPLLQLIYTSMQLYFIFLNSKICIHGYRTLSQFGAMHMVATNLCSWLRYITAHTVSSLADSTTLSTTNHHKDLISQHHNLTHDWNDLHGTDNSTTLETPGLDCSQETMLFTVARSVGHLLFPCVIEYCLISAAVMVVIWANIDRHAAPVKSNGSAETKKPDRNRPVSASEAIMSIRNYFSFDCSGATLGLFGGLFVLVVTLVGVILCTVLIRQQTNSNITVTTSNQSKHDTHHHEVAPSHDHAEDDVKMNAVIVAQLMHLILYSAAGTVALVASYRIREMRYDRKSETALDEILLVLSVIGVFMLRVFYIISGYYNTDPNHETVCQVILFTGIIVIIQTFLQTVFILDALHRFPRDSAQQEDKPGLTCVTFLLFCNIAIWIVSTLVMLSQDTNIVPYQFFGATLWGIISNVATPLTIFYQFHATVCLSIIWKTAYKIKKN